MAATAKRDRNQRLWDDARALCDAVAEEYRVATDARNEELELLADIKARVEARYFIKFILYNFKDSENYLKMLLEEEAKMNSNKKIGKTNMIMKDLLSKHDFIIRFNLITYYDIYS